MPHTLAQLEAFVSSPHYDSATAGLIASRIPELPRLKGEQIAPGITRIHGNLCNVHGRYGPCDKGLSGKKPRKPRKGRTPAAPKKTDAQRSQERGAKRQQNTASVAQQMAENDTGLSPGGSRALTAFAKGQQPDAQTGAGLAKMGLAERASDGSYRMTPTGHAVVAAMASGDYQRAVDAVSRGTDASGKRTERQTAQQTRQAAAATRRQDVAARRAAAQVKREQAAAERAKRKPAKASARGAAKKPEKPAAEKPRRPTRRVARAAPPSAPALSSSPSKPKPAPAKAPAKQIAPALQTAAQSLSDGKELSDDDAQALIRNGLARLVKGVLVLTAAGQRQTMKALKAQSDQDKAMFANMGGGSGGSGGSGSGGSGGTSKLWPKGPSGKRTPQAAAAQSGGGAKGDAKPAKGTPTKADAQQALQSHRKRTAEAKDKTSQVYKLEAQADRAKRDGDKGRAADLQRQADTLRADAKKLDTDPRNISDMKIIGDAGFHMSNDGSRLIPSRHSTTPKMKSFRVFKDANGQPRWVAQSSTAFQDRDREIVSTKALADDCVWADTHDNAYGPLRWWHTPGLDLGDCDFNAMHGRVLIESGTFRSDAIAQKVAAAADALEISLGFIHLPSEPDADGVFHHIRRFERSLVPRGKASNRFTAFTVKETRMSFDPTKVAALKTLGFSDADIAGLETQAELTEKAATDQGVAFKADEPAELPDVIINGVTYKAFPPVKADEDADVVVEEDAIGDMPMDEEAPIDENALTLSAGDLAAISEAITQGITQIMGALDLEKKVAGHVQGLLAPFQQAQTTKDAEAAEQRARIAALQTQLTDLTGDQPARPYRPSAAKDNVLTDAAMLAAVKAANDPNANDPWADIKVGLGLIPSQ